MATPSRSDPVAGQRYLLLADISGYTAFLNGVELKTPAPLADGDMVRIGTVTLKVSLRRE